MSFVIKSYRSPRASLDRTVEAYSPAWFESAALSGRRANVRLPGGADEEVELSAEQSQGSHN